MKIGVSSYSFHRLVASKQMTQLEVIAKAKEIGFDVIEFSTLDIDETPEAFAPKIAEECARVGIEVGNYTIGGNFHKGDWRTEAKRLESEVRAAKLMGAPGMRHDVSYGPPAGGSQLWEDNLEALANGCRAVTEFAATQGIRTMMENHGFFAQDSRRVEQLMNAVAHPNFGWLVDMGNFMCADEAPEKAVARAMPYAFHVHAKDFYWKDGSLPNPGQGWFQTRAGHYLKGAIIGHGVVPIVHCLRLMKQAKYQGVLSIEFEGMEEPLTGVAVGLENLRRYVAMVEAE